MAWSEEPNVTNWFDKFVKSIKNPFGGEYQSPFQGQIESNSKNLAAKTSAPGYRAPLGESGSVIGDLLTGSRGTYKAPVPESAQGGNSQPWDWRASAQPVPELDTFPGFGEDDGGRNTDAIWDRLNQNFSFDRSSADTSAFDEALASRMALIEKAKGTTNSNFAQSDSNLKAMHDAFQQDTLSQRPDIAGQYDTSAGEIGKAFGDTVDSNRQQQGDYNKSREEMLQRLGIAPAAGQPDVVNEAFAKTIGKAQGGEDSRLAENSVNKTSALDRNTNFAQAIGAEGVNRRSNLNMQLQDILGKLEGQGADYQSQAAESKMNYVNGQEDKSYNRWLQDRNFDFNLLGEENNYNRGVASDQAKSEAEMAKMQMEGQKAGNQSAGFDGLWGGTPPEVQQSVLAAARKMDVNENVQKTYNYILKNNANIDPDQLWNYLNKRDTLGNTTKFDVQ